MQHSSNSPNDNIEKHLSEEQRDLSSVASAVAESQMRSYQQEPDQQNGHENEITWPLQIKAVGYWRQFYVLLRYKNIPLLTRKPVHMLLMLLSSVGSVLLAWPAAENLPEDTIFPNVTECGAVPPGFADSLQNYEDQYKVAFSLNDPWQSGLGVTVLCLGKSLGFQICMFGNFVNLIIFFFWVLAVFVFH
jgi:hypothetical protein